MKRLFKPLTKVPVNTLVVGWGTLAKNLLATYKKGCKFLESIRKTGYEFEPIKFLALKTAARCKNSLAFYDFYSFKDELSKPLERHVPGTTYVTSAVATGGGTANIGMMILPILRKMAVYVTLRIYLTHELFLSNMSNPEVARRYINSDVQLSFAGKLLNQGLYSIEILGMNELFNQYGNSYHNVDTGVQELQNIITACCSHPDSRFDMEDVRADPNFRVCTCGHAEISLTNSYETIMSRSSYEVRNMKPLSSPKYFSNHVKTCVTGSPIIFVAGPYDIVMHIQESQIGYYKNARSLNEIEKLLESNTNTSYCPTIIPFPLDIDKIHMAAIFPVDAKWFEAQCMNANKRIMELYDKARKNNTDTLLSRVFKSMLEQAGNPRIEDYLEM